MTNNVTIIRAEDFKFARGFKMPNDQNLVDTGKDWVKWGKDNLFPNFLNHILYSSAYQSGIIRGKVHYITGSGWTPKAGTQEQIDEMFGQWNCQDVLEMIVKDYEMYNGFALRVLRSVEGKETFEHIDFDMLRVDAQGRGWWYSDDWSKSQQSEEETGLKLILNYDPRTPQFESVYVYCEKPKNKSIRMSPKQAQNVYPEPVYAGALKSLMTDVEIQSFHLYNIINGMKVAGVLNFANGEPPEKSKFEAAVQDALTPTEHAGGILINYSDGDDRKPTWIPLSNEDLDKRYLTLETSVVQNIMTGHSVTSPMLFGIKTQGQLGGTTEMNDAFEIFKRTYVRGRQTTIESHINYLLKTVAIQLNEPEPLIKVEQPTPQPQPQPDVMKMEQETEDKVLLALLKRGKKKDKYKVLSENLIESEDFDFEAGEAQLLTLNFAEEPQLQVMYSYELRPDVEGPAVLPDGRTRTFCQTLIESGLIFTRQEIDDISQEVDRDVWLYRGGWYSDPDKPRPTKFCRHLWKQQLVLLQPDEVPQVPEDLTIDFVKEKSIPNIMKDLGLENDGLKFTYGKLTGNTGGEVSFIKQGGKYIMGNQVRIDAAKYKNSPEQLAQIIRHELRHIYQSKEMGFYVKDGFFHWQNKPYISVKDYNKIMKAVKNAKNKEEFDKHIQKYKDLPWESDADQYMMKLIFSEDKPYIETVEDNGLIDLIELPEELIKEIEENA